MSALNFKAQFAGDVEARRKTQSIRASADRFQVGKPIQLYTGMRTAACRKLVDQDPVCTAITPIIIRRDYVALDGWRLPSGDFAAMAAKDGFASVSAFLEFFLPNERDQFDGFLIQWRWE